MLVQILWIPATYNTRPSVETSVGRGARIKVDLAVLSDPALHTGAGVGSDSVAAGASVETRVGRTQLDELITAGSSVPRLTQAQIASVVVL